jgi:hypothetical protein
MPAPPAFSVYVVDNVTGVPAVAAVGETDVTDGGIESAASTAAGKTVAAKIPKDATHVRNLLDIRK